MTVVLPALPQRHQSTSARSTAAPPSPRRALVATTTPRPRTIDYAAERTLIRLALAGGMVPGQVAALLRGSPQARRRRVLKIARELQRPAVQSKGLVVINDPTYHRAEDLPKLRVPAPGSSHV